MKIYVLLRKHFCEDEYEDYSEVYVVEASANKDSLQTLMKELDKNWGASIQQYKEDMKVLANNIKELLSKSPNEISYSDFTFFVPEKKRTQGNLPYILAQHWEEILNKEETHCLSKISSLDISHLTPVKYPVKSNERSPIEYLSIHETELNED